ncbi:MAG: tol-pal system YbgF family protein, partial [Planctomycetota bacterium]
MSLLAVLLLLIPAPQDLVFTRDGRTLHGEIVRASLTEVVLKPADAEEVTLAGGDVIRIRHGNAPETLTRARRFLAAGDYQNAVSSFQAAESGEGPPWVAVVAPLERAEALLAWSQIDPNQAPEALDLFNDWLAGHPDHFLAVRARVGQARALARTGKVDEAAARLEELGTFAFEKNLGKRV